MEKIIIDDFLYNCKEGTNQRIQDAYDKGHKATPEQHERGTAFAKFNQVLDEIKSTHKAVFIENAWKSY